MSEGTQWVHDEGWVPTCSFQTFPGSVWNFDPPEWCDEDVLPGTEFCALHTEDPLDPEDQAEEIVYGSFGECYDFFTGDSRG